MKKKAFYLLLIIFCSTCNEVTEFYTKGYKYSYARPIGIGVDYADYVKPEIATYPVPIGNSNTTPVITGLVACIPEKKVIERAEVKRILIESSNNFKSPNNEIGYGVPNTNKIIEKMKK